MVDAYEIGIRLALQDDVSAGLESIGRELTEVDRAIAATNAGLLALARTADGTARLSGATVVRPATLTGQPTAEVDLASRAESVARGAAGGEQPTSTASQPVAPGRSHVEDAVSKAERSQAAPQRQAINPEVRAQVADTVPTTAPQQSMPSELLVQQPASSSVPPLTEASSVRIGRETSVSVPPTTNGTDVLRPATINVTTRATRENTSRATGHSTPMRASVNEAVGARPRREETAERPATLPEFSLRMPTALPLGGSTLGATTWKGMEPPNQLGAGPLDRATAAPQPQPREQSEGSGGTVMLDGHLVGYWLTERMAREASRPLGGTSFFDPRQAPAWTPSGAL